MDKSPQAKSQMDKFREAARQLETDDDENRFNERLGKVAKAPFRVPTGFQRDKNAAQED